MAQVYILWLSQSFRQTENTEVYTAQEIAASLRPGGQKIHFPTTSIISQLLSINHLSLVRHQQKSEKAFSKQTNSLLMENV